MLHRTFSRKLKLHQIGFTLIELMVVVAIIGVLMAAGLITYSNAQKGARDAQREAEIDSIAKAMELYFQNNANVYPVAANYAALNFGTSYYPQGMPKDPKNTGVYVYTGVSSATAYCSCAALEQLGKGNATANASSTVCSFGTPAAGAQGYFCVENQQ